MSVSLCVAGAGSAVKRSDPLENWLFLKKLNTELLYRPAALLLAVYLPKGINNIGLYKICPQMFVAVLFPTAKSWKQLRYLSANERINKMW